MGALSVCESSCEMTAEMEKLCYWNFESLPSYNQESCLHDYFALLRVQNKEPPLLLF